MKMFEELFYKRLVTLRTEKGVSARDMSLTIGQGHPFSLMSYRLDILLSCF